ncbi:nitrite reductase small subunit NirD [Vibrio sp. SCSIO 43136]|uniref:nitrite reductase small subunit NirD n=1 Tax=Vibrio sp. SCSIO 43136 TaxID=2819101 RepID=UPI002075BB3F|nr:nitrite reductase small subunit NirD [Vibrio sp. SCSIO 43136]USD67560.1 nitrite reductase small subunit NirD [Vibrio sp. SCSIO 43136]
MEKWVSICSVEDIAPNVGVCALVEGKQVAVFNDARSGQLYAISNYDPIGKANILSRGIIGTIEGEPYVASPLYKQHFHLATGACLEEPQHSIETFGLKVEAGQIFVAAKELAPTAQAVA